MHHLLHIALLLLLALPLWAEQRNGYRVEQVEVPVTHGEMAKGYLLLPDKASQHPCPAIIACHDHGARFSIGKEKLCRPILSADSLPTEKARLAEAVAWVNKYYAGAFVADTLAAHGYVVLVIDACYWGSRTAEPVDYQQSTDSIKRLNKRLKNEQPQFYEQHLQATGEPWFETILADDRACITYLQSRPEVKKAQIGVWGFSMGAYRAWQLAAEDKRIRFCAAANWMTTSAERGKNLSGKASWQLPDASGYSMYRPMKEDVDYGAIVSSIAPRPMLLQYGSHDHLFPYGNHGIKQWKKLRIEELEGEHRYTDIHLRNLLQFLKEINEHRL